ncbi:MAG TPA: leucyl aminopeptidase [Patescibacteria group bacterium]|nr:leucyl aminopeptidase [Patescibacteria group bacterium]
MKIQIAAKPLTEIKDGFLVLPVFEDEKQDYGISLVKNYLADNPKFGKLFEGQILYSDNSKILLIGAGKKEKLDFVSLQNLAGAAVRKLLKKSKSLSLVLPKAGKLSEEEKTYAAALGIEIAAFDPTADFKFKHEPSTLTQVELLVDRAERGLMEGLKKGQIIAESINLTRKLGDLPANIMTPSYFLEVAKKVAKDNKLKITILDEKQTKKKGMGAFSGVAQGSEEPSFMIALEYTGDIKNKDKWAFVGKGITFDTGGLSIKPSGGMHEMKYDMTGAAAVMTAIVAVAKLNLKTNVVAVMAVTENLPGGRAQRPGDIVKTYSGKFAEIMDTDAEGRLVLIDAVSYAQKDFKANKVIDLATLTGAIIVSLGDHITGVFGNRNEFTKNFMEVSRKYGEKVWELPMYDEFDEMIKSQMADIANIGHGGSHRSAAGSITGAKFIEAGVEEGTEWIHLDIAGTAWDMKPKPYRGVGATGVGVKTLVELIS